MLLLLFIMIFGVMIIFMNMGLFMTMFFGEWWLLILTINIFIIVIITIIIVNSGSCKEYPWQEISFLHTNCWKYFKLTKCIYFYLFYIVRYDLTWNTKWFSFSYKFFACQKSNLHLVTQIQERQQILVYLVNLHFLADW